MKTLGRFLWGKIYVLFFRPLYWIENSAFFWPLVNREAVAHFKKNSRNPTPSEAKLLQDLKRDGIAVTSLDELFGNGEELLRELITFSTIAESHAHPHPVKSFITDFFDSIPVVNKSNPFLRLALDERTLTIASHYLGMTPKLQEFALAEITAVPDRTDKIGSMKWHRDPNDRKLLKMFIYLYDVGPQNGPFTYLKGSNAGNKYSSLCPQVPPSGIYPPQEEVENNIDTKDLFSAEGKAGSIIFADTAGLHRGGYVLEGKRRMSTVGFLPPKSFLAQMLKYKDDPTENLTPQQDFVVHAHESLFSREAYIWLKKTLVGEKSLGVHIMGAQGMK